MSVRHLTRSGKPIRSLSDDELIEEARYRRRRRGQGNAALGLGSSPVDADDAIVRKHYASLELRAGAALDQVEAAYQRLLKKYHPQKHRDDPEKQRAATELTEKLTKAYEALVEHLKHRRR